LPNDKRPLISTKITDKETNMNKKASLVECFYNKTILLEVDQQFKDAKQNLQYVEEEI
jgi:hypothetical protein